MAVKVTRMELFRLARQGLLAERGRDLLSEKQSVLLMEFFSYAQAIGPLQKKIDWMFAGIYESMAKAEMAMGRTNFERASLTSTDRFGVDVETRTVMGVPVPRLRLARLSEAREIPYSLSGTSSSLDEAFTRLEEALTAVLSLAETEFVARRLAQELMKIKRRINALEHIIIPMIRSRVRFIEDRLSETERETFFRTKRIKAILERRETATSS